MKSLKNILIYGIVIGGFSGLIYFISVQGERLNTKTQVAASGKDNHWLSFTDSLSHNLHHPLAILLAQIITIIVVARIFGWICKWLGQPTVMGEIVAGVVLGPSLFGMYFPSVSAELFPVESLTNLQFLSQVGLILFMYIIGMELDLKMLRNKAKDVIIISHASIIIPFALGMLLAFYLFTSFAPAGIQFASFSLFLGISMSITAFPVLARILQERNMHKTKIGAIVITCAAANDIAGWCLLASVIAVVKAGSFASSLYNFLFAAVYVAVMIKLVKPFLKQIADAHLSRQSLKKSVMAIFFVVLILSSLVTEVIGIHALFGAFMTGVIMPNNMNFKNIIIEKLEDITLVLLLPLFFVFTGLRTQIGLLNDSHLWLITGLIILVASVGKFAGTTLSAKLVGQTWKDSLTIGTLMNTRGLMELVVLNIGYDLGVITPTMFTMMVIMALVTTFMTGPLLNLINLIFKKEETVTEHIIIQPTVPETIS